MKNGKIKVYLQLLLSFMKIGVVTFGGGYAMIPIIENETSKKRKWISESDLIDVVAISESTPGPIAICAASFIGYKVSGFIGAMCATLGVVLPSFVIIYLISLFLQEFSTYDIVRYAFTGIRAGVLALIIKAVISMYKKAPKHILSYIIMSLSFLLVVFFSTNVLVIILSSAVIGIVASIIERKRGRELR